MPEPTRGTQALEESPAPSPRESSVRWVVDLKSNRVVKQPPAQAPVAQG